MCVVFVCCVIMAKSMSHQQQLLRDSWLTGSNSPSPPPSSNMNQSRRGEHRTSERETIHSGQFMVSHFEAEAQDDEDQEIAMPDPDESAIHELNTCTDVQLLTCNDGSGNTSLVPANSRASNSAVIDISLAKLFKCMNLAYRLVNITIDSNKYKPYFNYIDKFFQSKKY